MTFEHTHTEWSGVMFSILRDAGVKLFCYVPDRGNDRLISLAETDNKARAILLTTEEEGLAICAGADLVGERGILCMQSSGVGNCINALALPNICRIPFLNLLLKVKTKCKNSRSNCSLQPLAMSDLTTP